MLMLGIGTLFLLNILFAVYWVRIFIEQRRSLDTNSENATSRLASLRSQEVELDKENDRLFAQVDETVALYDLTRHICKSLESDKVLAAFREQLSSYLPVKDCVFVKDQAGLAEYQGYTVLPLEIGSALLGYLAIDGAGDSSRDKLGILVNLFMLGMKRVLLYQKVQELAITDSLTGLYTRRYYMERFAGELERSKKYGFNFSFLMVDIDHFKEFNDRFGHMVGDVILKNVAGVVKDNIRQVDTVGRYGGEEFVVILTETDKNGARFAAERIRQAMESSRIKAYDETLNITVSIGIATYPEDGKEMLQVLEKADMALYRAKQTGRNRICIHGIYR